MRCIDADALIEELTIDPIECPGCPEPEFLSDFLAIVASAPTVDAVPVSPCDACKYAPPSSGDGKPCTMCPAEGR